MTDATTLTTDPILQRYLATADATAYVPTTSAVQDAAQRFETALSNVRRAVAEVAGDDAADRMVAALEAHGHAEGRTLVGVVGGDAEDGDRVWHLADEIGEDVVGGPLPSLGRLLAAQQAWVPHVLVVLDRIGADIDVVQAQGVTQHGTIQGTKSHVTKSNPGGWSQRRFQQRADEHRDDNIESVTEALTDIVRATGIELVMVTGGPPDALSRLVDQLPQEIADHIVDLEAGGRAEDGSEDAVHTAVDAAVRREAARRRADAQRDVLAAVERGNGVTGREQVLEMLFEGRVDTLLVHHDSADGITAHFGDRPEQVAADSGTLHALDLPATRAPLVDVALRGAAATGATVVALVDAVAEVTDGLAASLRG
ncbi:Vms1/Ankzf1 family peptidyl-tRNA hydrolase [Euzebya sp.]|uniref:baeRF2 domain-containing protein n=1 Tax=Euzebya sp. TaxID=1971409 RepID=UPI003516F8DA